MIALVFIGPPCSGKSTLAKATAETLNLELISSGEIARGMSKLDLDAKASLGQGDWAPELSMRYEVQMRIEAATIATGNFVIEGFPRRLEQLYILESVVGIQPLYFIIECDILVCMRRLVARGREDDHADAVATRFRSYQEFTEPVIAALINESIDLDGNLSTEILVENVVDSYNRELTR